MSRRAAANNPWETALHRLGDLPTRVDFGPAKLDALGEHAGSIGARTVLLVTDPGIIAAGHVERGLASLKRGGIEAVVFDGAAENPTTEHVNAGLEAARGQTIDLIVALGGGSAMDCAKAINLLLTNGGQVADYWGINKAVNPLRPFVAVPTTGGTGSEAQSFALITDAVTRRKMACGDRRLPSEGGLRPRVAILDPDLLATVPQAVVAAAGIDAIAHAVETAATRTRNNFSLRLSKAAWDLLEPAFELYLAELGLDHGLASQDRATHEARCPMLLGAHLAGAAIEHSMLGADHACANPLTARYGIRHGAAVGLMLPHVIRFNCAEGTNFYAPLSDDPQRLVRQVEALLDAARLPRTLSDYGVPNADLPELAQLAEAEWTAGHNPRPVAQAELLQIYEWAY
jgi:alcohol dehydrogenase